MIGSTVHKERKGDSPVQGDSLEEPKREQNGDPKHAAGITEDDKDGEDDEDMEDYSHLVSAVRTSTGLEIGLKITWPGLPKPLELSTQLPSTAIAPMFHGTQWAGTRVWRAAIVGLQYLLQEKETHHLTSESRILELGCGLGVPGMVLHALTDATVVLSDKDDLAEQLAENAKKNFPESDRLHVHALDWSKQGVSDLLRALPQATATGFDIILNCDCIYEPLYRDSWKYLAECQIELLRLFPASIMLTCVERRVADGLEHYIAAMEDSPQVSRVEQITLTVPHPPEVELYRIYSS